MGDIVEGMFSDGFMEPEWWWDNYGPDSENWSDADVFPVKRTDLTVFPSKDGLIPIKDMTDKHLANAISYMLRKKWLTPFLGVLLNESNRRERIGLVVEEPPVVPSLLSEASRGDVPCYDCGTLDNIVWFTDNVVWNEVCRPEGFTHDPILCVTCFVVRAEKVIAPTGWRIIPEYPVRKVYYA